MLFGKNIQRSKKELDVKKMISTEVKNSEEELEDKVKISQKVECRDSGKTWRPETGKSVLEFQDPNNKTSRKRKIGKPEDRKLLK